MKRTSLNHVYRIVWSQVLDAWVAVAEITHGRGKSKTSRKSRASNGRLIAAIVSLSATLAQAAPAGGQIAAGSGSISQSGATTTVQQASSKLSVNWASFNLAPQEAVNFVQPSAAAIAVNRIFDTNGSQILGQLNANGQVYLINPNGIVFGQGAQVNVGGLVASTLDLNDASLNGDARRFSGNGGGSIVNLGTINAARGGYVALLGNQVSNQGVITAQLGTVALAAGSAATLTFSGNSLVAMQVDQSVLNSLAENGGLIRADGGLVAMTAGARNALLASVVNNTGIIEARTVEDHNGTIVLLGGMQAGQAKVGGTLDASAPNGGNGGFIETSAAHVTVANDARVTTAAPLGNHGSWLIDPQDFNVAASGGDISGATLSTTLGSTPVTIQSSGGGSTGSGNIDVDDALSWSADTTLTLTASKHVNVNANITATGNAAGLAINANTANGSETASGDGAFNLKSGASITLSGANPSLAIGGTAYTVINSLGVAGDATTAPATPTLQGMAAAANLSGKYALGTDIDAAATAAWNLGEGFTPVGSGGAAFNGTFDGLGHTVSNLTTNLPGVDYVGLFGNAGTPSAIRNLGLVSGSVSGRNAVGGLAGWNSGSISNSYATNSVDGAYYVGGLVGYNTGAISNAHATGTVNGSGPYVGGLVGWNNPSATISNAYATGSVSGSGNNVGGLVGFNSYGAISDAYATGTVSGSYAGGLVGLNDHGSISNSHATGNVGGSGSDYVGGLVGYNVGSTISNTYASGAVTGSGTNLGGLFGYNSGSTVTNSHFDVDLSTVNGQSSFALYGLYHDQLQDWASHGMTLAIADYGASLPYDSVSGSYGIGSIQGLKDLQGFAEAAGVQFRLTADLDLASLPGYYLPNFSATGLDGAGHSLANLTLNLPAVSGVGFISDLASGSTVSNLSLTNVSVSGGSYVGALAGTNNGTLSNVDSSGVVTGSGPFVGGLVGYTPGMISDSHSSATVSSVSSHVGGLAGVSSGPISNAYATGTVSGSGPYVGGLVGWNSSATISNAYATGSVSGSGNAVGGLVGYNASGTIDHAYATGTVSGSQAGGLVGINDHATISNSHATGNVGGSSSEYVGGLVGHNLGTISKAYATGAVSGAHYVGGLVGNNDGSVGNSYYDIDQTMVNGQSLVTPYGLYHTQFQDWQSHGQTLDIADYGSSLPFDNISGSYGIGSVQGLKDLLGFAELPGAQFRLASDLDLASLPGYYLPVFSATSLDGADHSIANLKIDLPFNNNVGFIGNLATGGTVSNVNLANVSVTGDTSVGGLVGANYGTVSNASSSGTVTGVSQVGGLVGASSGSISGSGSSGSVTGVNYVGGLAGVSSGSISSSGSSGSVTGVNYVGGLVGNNGSFGSISNAHATGSVTGSSSVGGLVGWNGNGPWYSVQSITNSYATGSVSGDTRVGGLVGWNGGGQPFSTNSIANCYATGSVVGTGDNIGGLVGFNGQVDDYGFFNRPPVSNSYATGPVSGADRTGGLVGANAGTITNSFATGWVSSGGSYVGGLVGQNFIAYYIGYFLINYYAGTLTNSGWDTTTTGQLASHVGGNGGGFGMTTAQMQQQANFTSATSANGNANPAWDFAHTWVMYDNHTYPLLGVFMTPLTVTANDMTKTYDGLPNSGGNGVSYSTPPNLANLSGTLIYTGSSQGATNTGTYVITPSGLSSLYSNQQGYVITYADGTLTIDPATLTFTADAVSRTYGQANPLLSGSITGFVGSDTLANATTGTETFSTPATSTSNVGSYAVTGSGLTANYGNYVFAQAPGNASALTIAPATLTVTADPVSRIYGAANPLLSGSITGFVGSDTLASATTGTETFSTPATSTSNVGSYAITGSGLSANFGNYLFAQAPGNASALTIAPATLTYVATPASFAAGQTPSALSGTVEGFVAGDGLASSTSGTLAWLTAASASSPAGLYAINGSGLTATNYIFAQAAGNATALTLNPVTPLDPTAKPPSSNAANSATPTTTTSNVTTNATNVPPPTQAASNLLATTQLLTNVLASLQSIEPEPPDPSSTLTVNEVSGAPPAGETASPPAGDKIDVLSNIGSIGPTLYIVNGGTRLPANQLTGN